MGLLAAPSFLTVFNETMTGAGGANGTESKLTVKSSTARPASLPASSSLSQRRNNSCPGDTTRLGTAMFVNTTRLLATFPSSDAPAWVVTYGDLKFNSGTEVQEEFVAGSESMIGVFES